VTLAALVAGPASFARAQAPAADSLGLHPVATPIATPIATPPGARLAGPPAPDTSAADTTIVRKRPWTEQPRVVMLRSLLVPGWGQWHNHAHLKALGIGGVEGWILGGMIVNNRRLNTLLGQVNAAARDTTPGAQDRYERARLAYNDRLDQVVSGTWLLAGVLAYSLVDAYVDAHFRTFETDFRTDPALPPDESPAGPSSDAHRARVLRLSLRWRF
jgi:hypothetical protein